MEEIDIVFCVLTYKNYKDLEEFILSVRTIQSTDFTYKIVVVNSFADDTSLVKIREIALKYQCIFIESENKGYGYGNNKGIEFIIESYSFKYLIVSNPDTIIESIELRFLEGLNDKIIGPRISKLNGRRQNPMNYIYMPISEKILYYGFKKNLKLSIYLGILLIKLNNSIRRQLYSLFKRDRHLIHACHGSFIIFGKEAIKKLLPVFDDKIFLFGEEGDLAQKCRELDLLVVYEDRIRIKHKEDGSMKYSKLNINNLLRESYIYYYEKWHKKYRKEVV